MSEGVADYLANRRFTVDSAVFACDAPCYPDSDGDTYGDNIDNDRDGDGISNTKITNGTDPDDRDTDGDDVIDVQSLPASRHGGQRFRWRRRWRQCRQ